MKKMRIRDKDKIEEKISVLDHGFSIWSNLSTKDRVKRVGKLRKTIALRALEIGEAISQECGRPIEESISQEVLAVLETLKYYEKKLPRSLAPVSVRYMRPGFIRKKNYIFREPLGTFAVITPFNFPFSLGIMSTGYLLLSGNTVALKPSERSEMVAPLIEDILKESGLAPDFVNVFTGGANTSDLLIENDKVRKIVLFGSRGAGRSVAEKAIKKFKPFILELGGGSTAFVSNDADIKLAAWAIAWSGFYSNGQSCVGTDRVYVEKEISSNFLKELTQNANKMQKCKTEKSNKGIYTEEDVNRLKNLIDEAVKDGAKILCGGDSSKAENGLFTMENTIITSVKKAAKIFNDEIFGPIIAIRTVDNLDEAILEMPECYQSLGASIWTSKKRRAFELSKSINTGMVWINDTSFGLPNLPWGGWDCAGWGKIFSKYAIDDVTKMKWVSYHSLFLARNRFWWPPYNKIKKKMMLLLANKFYRL